MSWSPLQREMLEAMGLSPYRLASAMPTDESPRVVVQENTAASAKTAAQTSGQASSARNPQVSSDADALAAALLRAAGRDRAAADRDSVLRACPPPQILRGDPRAKRALWPILRAMRRH